MYKLSRVILLISAVGTFGISEASAQQNPFGNLLQGMMEQAIIQGAIDEWRKLPSEMANCINNSLRRQGWTAVALGQRGIGPTDARVANIVEPCRAEYENQQAIIEEQQQAERQKVEEEKRQKAEEVKQKKLAEEQRVSEFKSITLKSNYECSIKDKEITFKSFCDDVLRLKSGGRVVTVDQAIKDKIATYDTEIVSSERDDAHDRRLSMMEKYPYERQVTSPSFDCAKAKLDYEKLICSNNILSFLDSTYSDYLEKAKNLDKKGAFKKSVDEFNRNRKSCAISEKCHRDNYINTINSLAQILTNISSPVDSAVQLLALKDDYTLEQRKIEEEATKQREAAEAKKQAELALTQAQLEDAKKLLTNLSEYTAKFKIEADPIHLATIVSELTEGIKGSDLNLITARKSELESILNRDTGYAAYKKQKDDELQRNQNNKLQNGLQLAKIEIEFIRTFLASHLTFEYSKDLAQIAKNLQASTESMLIEDIDKANNLAQVSFKKFSIAQDFEAYKKANLVPEQQANLQQTNNVVNPIKVTEKNSFIMKGQDGDIIVIYNAGKNAPHVAVNIAGKIVFEDGTADICWFQSSMPSSERLQLSIKKLNELGATKISNVSAICDEKNYQKKDLILFERSMFMRGKIDSVLPLITDFESGVFQKALLVDSDTVLAESQKKIALAQQIEDEVGKELRTGFGLIRVNNDNKVVCAAIDERRDGHSALLQKSNDDLMQALGGKYSIATMPSEQAFILAKKSQCGAIYANAKEMKLILEALKRDNISYRVISLWFQNNDISSENEKILAAKTAALQSEEEKKRLLEEEQKLKEASQSTAEAQRAKKQEALRNTYSAAAKALSDELGKSLVENSDIGLSMFSTYAGWYKQKLNELWEISDSRFELYDYGTAKWNDRRIDAVFVRYVIKIKNRTLGKYEERCSIMGWIADNEFSMRRDAFESSCDTAEANITKWQRSRAFEERWIVRQ